MSIQVKIFRDASRPESEIRLSEELKQIYMKYLSDPSVRTVDVIPRNEIFIAQLICAMNEGDIRRPPEDVLDK